MASGDGETGGQFWQSFDVVLVGNVPVAPVAVKPLCRCCDFRAVERESTVYATVPDGLEVQAPHAAGRAINWRRGARR